MAHELEWNDPQDAAQIVSETYRIRLEQAEVAANPISAEELIQIFTDQAAEENLTLDAETGGAAVKAIWDMEAQHRHPNVVRRFAAYIKQCAVQRNIAKIENPTIESVGMKISEMGIATPADIEAALQIAPLRIQPNFAWKPNAEQMLYYLQESAKKQGLKYGDDVELNMRTYFEGLLPFERSFRLVDNFLHDAAAVALVRSAENDTDHNELRFSDFQNIIAVKFRHTEENTQAIWDEYRKRRDNTPKPGGNTP